MSLISFYFLVFIASTILIYFLFPQQLRWVVLLLASFVFYLSVGVELVSYLIFTIFTTYSASILIDRLNEKYNAKIKKTDNKERKKVLKAYCLKRKQLIVGITVSLNIVLLAFFKWFNTIAAGVNELMGNFFPSFSIPLHDLLLPLGISFYTFQSVGYLIDVFRGKVKPETSILRYSLFVSFFPQLIQGPISRHDELAEQLYAPHSFSFTNLKYGIQLMVWGYFKKLVIADRIAIVVNEIFGAEVKYAGMYIFIGAIASAIRIYTDFSGGVDIARGVAEIFGIVMPENFMRPFFAGSLPEYWRRWHITLNHWWRDYVFYPITLSKGMIKLGKFCRNHFGHNLGKMISVYIGIYIVRIINAMWHGANGIYFFSGLYFGTLITAALIMTPLFEKTIKILGIRTDCFSWKLFQIIRTFFLVCLSRIFVSSPDLATAFKTYEVMFTHFNPEILFDGSLLKLGLDEKQVILLVISLLIVLIASILQEKGFVIRESLNRQNYVFQWFATVAMIFAVMIFGIYGAGYDESSFAYMRF